MLILNLIFLFLFSNFELIKTETEIVKLKEKIEPISIYDDYDNYLDIDDSEGLCLTSLTQADCASNEIIIPNGTPFGCPACSSDGLEVKAQCNVNVDDKCQFGLTCNKNSICDLDRSTCAYTYHLKRLSNDEAEIDESKLPTCEVDGTFAAVQCKGDRVTGRCFCYAPNGKRIYGWAWWHEIENKKMSCACSRLKYKMENQGLPDNTIHCDKFGNFEELQCNDGICWCADILSGEIMNNTRAVPENMWTFLPCYDSKYYGDQYLRQCESAAKSQHIIKNALYTHGTTKAEFNNIICDYDGSYGPIKRMNGNSYCQWTDGKNMAPYVDESKKLSNMNCFCARDQKIFTLAGLNHRLVCNGLGNYEPYQNINGKSFCVDNDGFAVNEAIETTEKIECKKYIYSSVEIKETETEYGGYGLNQINNNDNNYEYYYDYDNL